MSDLQMPQRKYWKWKQDEGLPVSLEDGFVREVERASSSWFGQQFTTMIVVFAIQKQVCGHVGTECWNRELCFWCKSANKTPGDTKPLKMPAPSTEENKV